MTIAQQTAKILLDTQCIQFSPLKPFTLTSGRVSPVYVDCRRLIAFVEERRAIISSLKETLENHIPTDNFDVIAGGETAGIPYAAFLSEAISKPMAYVRKKPKGFGKDASIEGNVSTGDRALLLEDMTTDGGSKVRFIHAMRHAELIVEHCLVVFEYGIFKNSNNALTNLGVQLHSLATWADVMEYARAENSFSAETLDGVQEFLDAPEDWHPKDKMQLQKF